MSNVYDVLYQQTRLNKKLPAPQETLALALAASGKIRLDADHNEANFTRLLVAAENLNLTFTRRELTTPHLLAGVHQKLTAKLTDKYGENAAAQAKFYLDKAVADLKKHIPTRTELELQLARALVLSNEYAVILLIHLEGAEIFISFGQNVGEVLDVAAWKENGSNSGMQAIGGGENAVYVSCGGNPFLEGDARRHTGDGFPALARFMVIAAQETGHNADMQRGERGQHVGRYSAEGWSVAPSAKAGAGRNKDIRNVQAWQDAAQACGLARLCEWERQVKFYVDLKLQHPRRTWSWVMSSIGWSVFCVRMRKKGMREIATLGKAPLRALHARTFLQDMAFNLSPVSEVYRRDTAQAEEAVATIEAVARVPQQVVKWGHEAVRATMPSLYTLYYKEIVPACVKACARYS